MNIAKEIERVKSKIIKRQNKIQARQAKSQKDFPGKKVVEVETMQDIIDIAVLHGEMMALKRIQKSIK